MSEITSTQVNNVNINLNSQLEGVAKTSLDYLNALPNNFNILSRIADTVTNLSVISGQCYHSESLSRFTLLNSSGATLDENGFIILEPASNTVALPSKHCGIVTEKEYSIVDRSTKALKSVKDLTLRNTPITIKTTENNYTYTVENLFQELKQINTVEIVLSKDSPSYPTITEIYYFNQKKEKISCTILNNNLKSFDTEAYRENTRFILNISTITADNLYISLEDNKQILKIDRLGYSLKNYNKPGFIVFKVLEQQLPILKAGVNFVGSRDGIDLELSNDGVRWYPVALSSDNSSKKASKIVSFNTIDTASIKTSKDVKDLYLKVRLTPQDTLLKNNVPVSRSVYKAGNFRVTPNYDEYSLYSATSALYAGKEAASFTFDSKELYDPLCNFVEFNNTLKLKGFVESPISTTQGAAVSTGKTVYNSKELRVSGDKIDANSIDCSSITLESFKVASTAKRITQNTKDVIVLKLKEEFYEGAYYVAQENNLIKVDLSLGYITSGIDVLLKVVPTLPVYLLNENKEVIKEVEKTKESYVSLIDTGMFELPFEINSLYPIAITELPGLFKSKVIGNLSNIKKYNYLKTNQLHYKTNINLAGNYIEPILDNSYRITLNTVQELVPSNVTNYKLKKCSILKDSLLVLENELTEVLYEDGSEEFTTTKSFIRTKVVGNSEEVYTFVHEGEYNVEENSISLRFLSEFEGSPTVEVVDNKITIHSDLSLKGMTFEIAYTCKITDTYGYYSVDYNKGVVWFSNKHLKTIPVKYKTDSMSMTGKIAKQLDSKDYSLVSDFVNIFNYEVSSDSIFVYKFNKDSTVKYSPILNNLKINYILKDEESV